MPLRVLFLGTPEFAVPTLEHLIEFPLADVVGVVTQPDRPAGRGNKLHPPPVKLLAEKHNIPVLQPESLKKSPEVVEEMIRLKPDLIVMVAFGQILKKAVLEMPPLGVINVHASLLPRYRGPAPLNWAIINGDTITGVTTMYTEPGVDTGPMLLKTEVEIGPEMNSVELAQELSRRGAELLIKTLEKLLDKTLVAEKQDDLLATSAPMLTKDLGKIDWNQTPHQIHNLVRAIVPWPGAFTHLHDSTLKVWKTRVLPDQQPVMMEAGSILRVGEHVNVVCGSHRQQIELLEVQPANKAKMSAKDWANGAHIKTGEIFS